LDGAVIEGIRYGGLSLYFLLCIDINTLSWFHMKEDMKDSINKVFEDTQNFSQN